jgi:hypothetical protein
MPNHFDFADFGKSFDCVACEFFAERLRWVHGGHIERRKLHPALAGRRLLEDQPFVLAGVLADLQNLSNLRFDIDGLGVQFKQLLKPGVREFA